MHSACLWQLWVLSLHGFSGSHTWMEKEMDEPPTVSLLLFVHPGSPVQHGTKQAAHEILLNAAYTAVPPTAVALLRPRKPAAARRWTWVLDAISRAHRAESDSREQARRQILSPQINQEDRGIIFKTSCSWGNTKLGRSNATVFTDPHSNISLSAAGSPVCFSWQPPHPCRKAGCPCSVGDKVGSGSQGRCWHSAVSRWPCSKRQTPCRTRSEGGKKPTLNTAQQKITQLQYGCTAELYLIHVMTVGAITTETCWAWATVPGSIWRAVALHSGKARVRQTAICIRLTWQERSMC